MNNRDKSKRNILFLQSNAWYRQSIMKFFFPFYLLAYFQESYFNITSVLIIILIGVIIIIFKVLLDKYVKLVIIFLPFLQILLTVLWRVDSLVNFQSKQVANQFTWMQGFQACYFHLAVMQQGYQVVPQSITIIVIYLMNTIFFAENSLEYLSQTLAQFCVVIGVILIKYTNEKLKRLQFIDNRERNKWVKIIEQIVDYQIIVVSFDKRQDQIVIKQIKDETKEKFKISDNSDFRSLLRDMQIINSSISQGKFSTGSLEMEIRQLFCQNSQQNIPSYEVISHTLKQEFSVKLVQYIFQEIQCVLIVFDSESRKEMKQAQHQQKLTESLFLSYSSRLLQAIQSNQNRIAILQSLVNLQLFRIWIDCKSMVNEKIHLNTTMLTRRLKNLFHQPINFKSKLADINIFSINLRMLEMILICCTEVIDNDFTLRISLRTLQGQDTLRFKLIFVGRMLLQQSQLHKIRRLVDFREQNWNKNRQKIIEYAVSGFKPKLSHKQDLIFSFIMCQYLLWFGFDQSQIQYKEHQNQLQYLYFDITI